jgi:hypothetical protein
MALRDMEHDRPRLEQGEVAFLVGRNLAEWMKLEMRGLLQRAERNKTNLVGPPNFLERPANARIPRQSLAAIGRPFEGGDGDGHREAAPWRKSSAGRALRLTLPPPLALVRSPLKFRPPCACYGTTFGGQASTALLLAPQSSKLMTVGLSKYPVCAFTGSEIKPGMLNSPFDM